MPAQSLTTPPRRIRHKFILTCESTFGTRRSKNVLGVFSSRRRATAKTEQYVTQTLATLNGENGEPAFRRERDGETTVIRRCDGKAVIEHRFTVERMEEDK